MKGTVDAAWEILRRQRRIVGGQCLNHVKRFINLPSESVFNLRVCMGPLDRSPELPILHCWIERERKVEHWDIPEVDVIDLITDQRLWVRDVYYRLNNVLEVDVKRYSVDQIWSFVGSSGLSFWGFDLSRYQPGPKPKGK